MPRCTTRRSELPSPIRMYLPRRPTDSMRWSTTASMNSSGSGCRTIVGKLSSQRVIVRPTSCGRRSAAIVSTSGNSGTDDSQLFHVGPVRACLHLDLDARLELVGAGHDARHFLRELVELGAGHLEEELMVDLEQHPALDLVGLDLALQPHHCDLDDVRRERLHREVDRHALRGTAELKVRRAQVGDGTAPPRGANDETLFPRLAAKVVQKLAQLRVGGTVLAEKFARHVADEAQLL